MNWTRFGLIILATCALAAFIVWARKAENLDGHRRARQFVLHHTLSRVDDPVIVIGDSIVEASTLPGSICGHSIVNAGLHGASTASDLDSWLSVALDGKRVALIVVSLGTKDALPSFAQSKQNFGGRYDALLGQLSKLTQQLVVMEIPAVETRAGMTPETHDEFMGTINIYNSLLPEIVRRHGATFVALPAMPKPHTIDGVHLNSGGYLAWDKAVMQAAAMICG